MNCLVALIVFGILGIFSVKYRKLAMTAFDCVFRRITLRPCQSGMDRKLKNKLVGLMSRKNVKLARFVVKRFELISWLFTILLILSIFFSARGIYFYVVYGNCNGENSDSFCVFDALHPEQEVGVCGDTSLGTGSEEIILPTVDDDPSIGPDDAKVTFIQFGCYGCHYTKQAEPVVREILEKYEGKIKFVYRDFPLPSHENSMLRSLASDCALEQNKFWEYHNLLFDEHVEHNFDIEMAFDIASQLNLDNEQFNSCLESQKYLDEVNKDFEDGKKAGVYGTPTFFITDQVVVGPKPFRYFSNIIDNELKE